jgi:hypothetical protein
MKLRKLKMQELTFISQLKHFYYFTWFTTEPFITTIFREGCKL